MIQRFSLLSLFFPLSFLLAVYHNFLYVVFLIGKLVDSEIVNEECVISDGIEMNTVPAHLKFWWLHRDMFTVKTRKAFSLSSILLNHVNSQPNFERKVLVLNAVDYVLHCTRHVLDDGFNMAIDTLSYTLRLVESTLKVDTLT